MELATAPATLTIVVVTATVTILAFRNEILYERLMLSVDAILSRSEWWRMLTSSLVHADWLHLFANMISLFAFGMWFEHAIAPWRFGLLYGIGVLVASFTSVIAYRTAVDYRAVGASGGVCAVIGGATVMFPDIKMMVFPVPVGIPAWIIGALFIVYSIVGSRERWDNVGHAAHLGGTLAGMGLVAAFFPGYVFGNIIYVLAILASGAAAWIWIRRRRPVKH